MDTTKIYLVTNCYGDPNKVYIGKEKSNQKHLKNRLYSHSKKFGKDIIFTYIDETKSLERKDWSLLECFWIEYFRQLGFNIQNKNKGGGGPCFQTDKTKKILSDFGKTKTNSLETRIKISIGRRKPILQYDLEGNFIKEWNSTDEYSKTNNLTNGSLITSVLKKKQNSAYNSLWIYKSGEIQNKIKPIDSIYNRLPILQYDLEGNFVKEWERLRDLKKELNMNTQSISHNLQGKILKSQGYIWKFKSI